MRLKDWGVIGEETGSKKHPIQATRRNYFFRFPALKLLGIVRVDGGSDRTRQRMPHPNAYDLARHAEHYALRHEEKKKS